MSKKRSFTKQITMLTSSLMTSFDFVFQSSNVKTIKTSMIDQGSVGIVATT